MSTAPTTIDPPRFPGERLHRNPADATGRLARSPLVAVAIAMTVVGLVIATTPPQLTERLLWLLPLLALSVESEIRTGSVSARLCGLVFCAFAVATTTTVGFAAFAPHLLGGLIAGLTCGPLLHGKRVTPGAVLGAGTIGVVVGASEIIGVLALAFALGLAAVAWLDRRAGQAAGVPLITLLGFATAALAL